MRASAAAGFLYDEIATQRKTQGVDEAIELWRDGAQTPDRYDCPAVRFLPRERL